MKTEQIILALTIAREKSINKAAQTLFISQPTASNMLKSLEAELGYPIFERSRAGMHLTEMGSEFIGYAGSIEQTLQAISSIHLPLKHINLNILSIKFYFTELAFEKLCEKYCTEDFAVDLGYQYINSTNTAARMVDDGYADIAVAICRKSLYEYLKQLSAKKKLEVSFIGWQHLEITCRKGHPLIEDDKIRYDLLNRYVCFTSIHTSDSELYSPFLLTNYGINIERSIAMDPGSARYRLLKKTNGYLISMPVSDRTREKYELNSAVIKDSELAVFAIYRADPMKDDLMNEFIELCRTCRNE